MSDEKFDREKWEPVYEWVADHPWVDAGRWPEKRGPDGEETGRLVVAVPGQKAVAFDDVSSALAYLENCG